MQCVPKAGWRPDTRYAQSPDFFDDVTFSKRVGEELGVTIKGRTIQAIDPVGAIAMSNMLCNQQKVMLGDVIEKANGNPHIWSAIGQSTKVVLTIRRPPAAPMNVDAGSAAAKVPEAITQWWASKGRRPIPWPGCYPKEGERWPWTKWLPTAPRHDGRPPGDQGGQLDQLR